MTFPVILDEPILNPFKLEPNSWHHKNMVSALETLSMAGNTGTHEDISVQMTYFKISFPFTPSTFFIAFFFSEEFREAKNGMTRKKKYIGLSLNLHHIKYDWPSWYESLNDIFE